MLLLSPNLMGGQRDVTCEIMYPNWCPCLLCNFQTILGKHYSYTNQGVEINEEKFWRGPEKNWRGCCVRNFAPYGENVPLYGDTTNTWKLTGKNSWRGPPKNGRGQRKTAHKKTKAYCSCQLHPQYEQLHLGTTPAGSQCFLSLVAPSNVTTTVSM
jgi:hypothetical protein